MGMVLDALLYISPTTLSIYIELDPSSLPSPLYNSIISLIHSSVSLHDSHLTILITPSLSSHFISSYLIPCPLILSHLIPCISSHVFHPIPSPSPSHSPPLHPPSHPIHLHPPNPTPQTQNHHNPNQTLQLHLSSIPISSPPLPTRAILQRNSPSTLILTYSKSGCW